jgi:hypothetical protein
VRSGESLAAYGWTASADHRETKRERYVGHFVFVVKDRVPNALIPVSPLGLTIT